MSQRSESLSVSTFGTRKPQSIETYVVDFNMVTKDGLLIPLQANVLQQITGPIRRGLLHQADVEFLQAITPERLADSIPVQSDLASIDILLGSDYFWSVIEGESFWIVIVVIKIRIHTYREIFGSYKGRC